MGEKITQLINGAASVLTHRSGVNLGARPNFYDRVALGDRALQRDFSAVAQDIQVARRERKPTR